MTRTRQLKRCASAVLLTLLLGSQVPVYAEEPDLATVRQFIDIMQSYMQLIHEMESVASDADKAAILQLMKIEDIYKNRGDRAEAIKVLTDVVAKTKSATVRNAASVMLADALNETGRASQAVEVLIQALEQNLK